MQNRVGSKFGGGGVAEASETNVDRRERQKKLALETIDLAKVSVVYYSLQQSYATRPLPIGSVHLPKSPWPF